jgi:aldose sugar dehydrogenase
MGIFSGMFRPRLLLALSPLSVLLASCGAAQSGESETAAQAPLPFAVTEMARFDEPWAMAFLPGTPYALVSQRGGKLMLWRQGGQAAEVMGVPAVDYAGQGGLGDVKPSPDFATSGTIFLSYAEAGAGDTRGAAVARATLDLRQPAPRLTDLAVIWRQFPKVTGDGHYSHRIAFSPDGKFLFISSGERQKFTPAQNMGQNLGKVIRLLPDGTPAPGNPFAATGGVAAQVWSLGHRNVLGLKFDTQGRLWDLEHGPAGGDELNLVKPGQNFGWPLVSNGDHYDGKPIPRHATRPDLAAPAISWNPVIAPGDFIFYSGSMFPEWRGQAIIAALGSGGLVRVAIEGETAREIERVPLGNRIREIVQAEDGAIWVLEDGDNARLLRLSAAK